MKKSKFAVIILLSVLYPFCAVSVWAQDLIPRYRLYNPNNFHHHYTTDPSEYQALSSSGWIPEGEACKIYDGFYSKDAVETVPYFRLYNPISYEHHWTTDANEYDLLGSLGWIREGPDGYVFAFQVSGSQPLYRLYNPNDGFRHWTMDANEKKVLIGLGFLDEGIACYVFPPSLEAIKVMTINLLFSEIVDRNKRLRIIADYVAENDVDYVLLQEVVRGDLSMTDNSAEDLKDFIFERHNLEYFVITETIPVLSGFLRVGNAILSRHEIEYVNSKQLPKSSEIELFGIYELELKRNVMMLRSKINGLGAIHVYNTHLCAGCGIKEREEQLDALLLFVKEIERDITGDNPVILGGDFNINRIKNGGEENYLYEKVLLEGFIDAYAAAAIDPLDELCEDEDIPDEHCTIGVTDLGDSNAGRIDYIFVKRFRNVTSSQVLFNSPITDDPTVSDHSAVLVGCRPALP